MNNKVLLVDDDPHILSSYRRILRKGFKVATADRGVKAITVLNEQGPFAVVVSDYQMPEMNGIQFLSLVQKLEPDTVRIMLSGQADLEATIDAVNKGNIFRFLTKPCQTEDLTRALNDALEQYRLIKAEQELLDKTLKGSIKILVDILSMTNPIAFSQSARLCTLARRLGSRMGIDNLWELELAAMFSHIGCVTVPINILEKKYQNQPLTEEENKVFLAHPQVGQKLLANIPRLENIAEAISYQLDGTENNCEQSPPFLAQFLKTITDYDYQLQMGKTSWQALESMRSGVKPYHREILAALEDEVKAGAITAGNTGDCIEKAIGVKDIICGMILADDIMHVNDILLISKGNEITEILKMRLLNLSRLGYISDPIKVLVRVPKPSP